MRRSHVVDGHTVCVRSIPAAAQKTTGTIQGVVTDPQSAVIANATGNGHATSPPRIHASDDRVPRVRSPRLTWTWESITSPSNTDLQDVCIPAVALDTSSIVTVNAPLRWATPPRK